LKFTEKLIAPCGINCGVCFVYLREKNNCCSCLSTGTNKPAHCSKCRIKFCDEHDKSEFRYCYECHKFPCTRLKGFDKRYIKKYHLSLIQNLKYINKYGVLQFINIENEKWKCNNCGEVLSVHKDSCLKCGSEYRKSPTEQNL